jgi:1-acyl-sn-glycerol-3-phosphate acyltransferase
MWVAHDAPLLYRFMQGLMWVLFGIFTRVKVTGRENIPLTGPVIVSPNHLHAFDIPITGMIIPRRTVIFAADKWQGKLAGMILERVTRVIYVARGEADRVALNQALEVLRGEGCMAVAPEGTRSRTGGLQRGKHGVAYLASRTGAPVVPVIIWGQERVIPEVLHLRRPVIHVTICTPWYPPPGADRARTADLDRYTDELMMVLAAGLPAQYRGAYADRVSDGSQK